VRYTDGARYRLSFDWERGFTRASYEFAPASQAGTDAPVRPADILATYSDEPDWGMDDDVERLRDVGVTKGIEGTGTRILRHFWYRGESHFGVELSEGQELDRRLELFLSLSRLAFAVGEEYWGYRFLAVALHYVQDLTQPFHVVGFISGKMVHKIDLVRSALCDFRRGLPRTEDSPPECEAELTLDRAKVRTGWLLGTYHSIYEDFGRGLLEGGIHGSRSYLSDPNRYHERYGNVPALDLSDPRRVPDQIRADVLPQAEPLAEALYGTFGHSYKYQVDACRRELALSGQDASVGERLAVASFYDFPLRDREREAKGQLLERTHALYARAGAWGRQLILAGMAAPAQGAPAALGLASAGGCPSSPLAKAAASSSARSESRGR
jgi:hypothetical protein